jgi:hypothetical protein
VLTVRSLCATHLFGFLYEQGTRYWHSLSPFHAWDYTPAFDDTEKGCISLRLLARGWIFYDDVGAKVMQPARRGCCARCISHVSPGTLPSTKIGPDAASALIYGRRRRRRLETSACRRGAMRRGNKGAFPRVSAYPPAADQYVIMLFGCSFCLLHLKMMIPADSD